MPSLWIGLAILLAIAVLLPTRRLYLAGWRGRALEAYFLVAWALAVGVALMPGVRTFLAPFLLVAVVAPFVTLAGAARAVRGAIVRGAGTEPTPRRLKDVTPRDDD